MTLNDSSSISYNTAFDGGGVLNFDGAVMLNGSSTISNNTAANKGGGVFNYGGSITATVTLNDSSSISGNNAGVDGGGVFNNPIAAVGLNGGTVTGNIPNNIAP